MSELLATVLWVIAIAGGIYALLEGWEVFQAIRGAPRAAVSGIDLLIGRSASVSGSFEPSLGGQRLFGRVLIDGESWRAELLGQHDNPPKLGEKVEIFAVDASKLTVTVR